MLRTRMDFAELYNGQHMLVVSSLYRDKLTRFRQIGSAGGLRH